MPSIVSFDAGATPARSHPLLASPVTVGAAGDPALAGGDRLRVVVAADLAQLLALATESDAAMIAVGSDPTNALAIIRQLRAAVSDLTIVAVEAPTAEAALAAADAGAHHATHLGADPRLVTLALHRAAECTAAHRELRSLRAQLPAGASASPLTTPFGDGRTVHPLRDLEREAIRHALAATGGRVGQAAKMLGMGRATLYRRLATFDVVRNP